MINKDELSVYEDKHPEITSLLHTADALLEEFEGEIPLVDDKSRYDTIDEFAVLDTIHTPFYDVVHKKVAGCSADTLTALVHRLAQDRCNLSDAGWCTMGLYTGALLGMLKDPFYHIDGASEHFPYLFFGAVSLPNTIVEDFDGDGIGGCIGYNTTHGFATGLLCFVDNLGANLGYLVNNVHTLVAVDNEWEGTLGLVGKCGTVLLYGNSGDGTNHLDFCEVHTVLFGENSGNMQLSYDGVSPIVIGYHDPAFDLSLESGMNSYIVHKDDRMNVYTNDNAKLMYDRMIGTYQHLIHSDLRNDWITQQRCRTEI